ncbi:hypothetical protein ATO13_22116 [Stappia sp. 22II-S9-Z10]|nr:hypothetical protein ATO13_22116 [Stappia sp. 22II-S9-Z10]
MSAVEKKAHVFERDPLDWYVEEPRATEALLKVERFVGRIIDPCCGQGNIVIAMRGAGYEAFGSDVVTRVEWTPWFIGEADWLGEGAPATGGAFPNIVMNPPFFRGNGTQAFIRRALSIATGKVAAFVDIKFLASAKRANGLFAERPPHRIWIVTPRVSCPPGAYLAAGNKAGGGSADWCWMVWDMTAPPAAAPALGWLRKGGAQ